MQSKTKMITYYNPETKTDNDSVKIIVYTGETIEHYCLSRHPVSEVKKAKEIIDLNKSNICYSNYSDFIAAIKYLAEQENIEVEFFLNGKSVGSDIEPIFEDLNRSYDLIKELTTKQ